MRLPYLAFAVAGLAMAGFVHAEPKAAAHAAADNNLDARETTSPLATPPTTTSTFTHTVAAGGLSAAPSTVPTHTIAVGATGFNFTPNNLTVAVGSVIEFNFYPGNHSVVRSAFKFPCIPYEDSGPNRVGFFSGYLNTNVYSSDGPKFRVRVNDTEPIFYYCSAPGSCITHGMLGVINPNSTWSLQVQEEYAANTTIQLAPGDPLPSEMAPTTVNGPGSTSSSGSSSSSSSGLSSGAIAGIVVGSIAGAITLIGLGIFFFCYARRNSRWQQERHRRLNAANANAAVNGNQLSPLSPMTRHGSSPGPVVGLGASTMGDMNGYFNQVDYRHRTPPPIPGQPSPSRNPYSGHQMTPTGQHMQFHRPYPYGQSPLHPSAYSPPPQPSQNQNGHLPIYNSMATMSPLQSHPTHGTLNGGTYPSILAQQGSPSPLYDKDVYYGATPPISTPTPPHPHAQYHQVHPPAPVELPTAVSPSTAPTSAPETQTHTQTQTASEVPADGGLRPPPPAPSVPRMESPTIGGMDRTWAKEDEASDLKI